jgi:hypothetical protein
MSVLLVDILNKPILDIKTPLALPNGTYRCICDMPGFVREDFTWNREGDELHFTFRPVEARADVDPKQLAASLNGFTLQCKKIRRRFLMMPEEVHLLVQFLLDDLEIKPHSSTSTLGEVINEAKGKEVYVELLDGYYNDNEQAIDYRIVHTMNSGTPYLAEAAPTEPPEASAA